MFKKNTAQIFAIVTIFILGAGAGIALTEPGKPIAQSLCGEEVHPVKVIRLKY